MKLAPLRIVVCVMAAACALLGVAGAGVSDAGIVRSCPIAIGTSTDPNCTPEVPRNDRAAIFDAYAVASSGGGSRAEDRAAVAVVAGALKSENYDVTEHEGPGGYARPQLAEFVALAKRASVLYISAHGVVPSVAGRECTAARSLYYEEERHGEVPPVPNLRKLDCSFQGGLAVQLEPSEADLIGAWSAYVEEGYSPDWLRPLEATVPGTHRRGFFLMLTTDGIEHFFHNAHLSLVIADACKSMTFAPDFNAESYFGYASTACTAEDLPDMTTLFDRLTGKDGIAYRNTSSAYAQGGWKSPVFQLSLQRPIALSPAVLDAGVNPAVTLSPMSPPTRQARFDTKMADGTDIITVAGCGATISNEKWSQNNTVLSYDLNIPDKPSSGDTLTLTIGHDKAIAAPGGLPNDQLDGNQSPSPGSGVAPNQSDYVVEKIPCAPVMNLFVSGSEDGTTVSGYVVGDQLTCTETGSVSQPYQLVLWNGAVPSGPDKWVNLGGEFNTPLGTWALGSAQGDQSSTINWLNPYIHIGSSSGTITQDAGGGSIDATFSDGGGPITANGSWTCPATAA